MSEWCTPELWDVMPQALSRVSGRLLHIYSDGVESGQVNLTVTDETEGVRGAQGEPICLMHSCREYGCAHYDLESSS